MSRKHNGHALCIKWALLIGVATKAKALLWHSWTVSLDSKHTEASFFAKFDWCNLLCSRVIQVPRPWDMAIFGLTITITTRRITLPLVHVCRVISLAGQPYLFSHFTHAFMPDGHVTRYCHFIGSIHVYIIVTQVDGSLFTINLTYYLPCDSVYVLFSISCLYLPMCHAPWCSYGWKIWWSLLIPVTGFFF